MRIVDRDELLAIVQSWPAGDQLAFVEEVRDRLEQSAEVFPLSDEQKVELDRRIMARKADPGTAIPCEQVRAKGLERLQSGRFRSSCVPKPNRSILRQKTVASAIERVGAECAKKQSRRILCASSCL